MHLPESLQDLADSETVRFLRRPKSISRICGGVRPWGSGHPGGQDTGEIRSQIREQRGGGQTGGRG